MPTLERILLPTDGSDGAAVATEHALAVADRFDAELVVLNVVDERSLDLGLGEDPLRERGDAIVAAAVERADAAGVPATGEVTVGVPDRAIREYAAARGIDLVVIGTHGRTGVRRYLLGSVTERVVRLSDAPVLTVRPSDDDRYEPYERLLVPTDGSERAAAAADWARTIATAYDATVHVLSAVDTATLGFDVRSDALVASLEAAAETAVEELATTLRDDGIEVRTSVEYGPPHGAILDAVGENDVDLVVMGTQGRSGIERYLLGSVTEKTVRTCPAPVLTVRTAGSE
ncbi:universal stress protein [Halomarina pelagica]|uniref:universal stress protein n=1 Tax=Halomarina pelagica TaxID=2961599 RepID=UPI0020C33AA7|nr:universal stress protein [Halomarina sp. BND7]